MNPFNYFNIQDGKLCDRMCQANPYKGNICSCKHATEPIGVSEVSDATGRMI